MSDYLQFKDNLFSRDEISSHHSMWARTEVLVGCGDILYADDPHRKARFAAGCPFTKSSNMVVIGGAQYAMEKIFGVPGDQIPIPTMYDENGIGIENSTPVTDNFLTPDGVQTAIYRHGNIVQLMGIGITGTAENDITVYPVDYREKNINLNTVNADGKQVTGVMLPFRYTTEVLSASERKQYFGKKTADDGNVGYYLKRFEALPTIKHVWKTGEDVDDETLVNPDDVWENIVGLNAVESFTEIVLKISRKDVKEWFISLEQEARTRFNTIALFTGEYVRSEDPADYGDYRDVRMFSKLCIPVEYLTLAKDINILYRIYSS